MRNLQDPPTHSALVPDMSLRIQVTARRVRFAALLSRLANRSLDEAWRVFRPLPAPDGPWGVPREASATRP